VHYFIDYIEKSLYKSELLDPTHHRGGGKAQMLIESIGCLTL
jgi:hypothetical protein